MTTRIGVLNLLGRALLASIFVFSGIGKIMNPEATIAYMTSHQIPAAPYLMAAASLVEILGGLSILLGYFARYGALLLFSFLVPVTLIFHGFWNYFGMEAQNQLIQFFKNLTIMGGLAGVIVHGSGRFSLDAKLHPEQARSLEEVDSLDKLDRAA